MGRVYRPPVTCIPLHVNKAPCADHLHTACALVTFMVGRSFRDLMLALGDHAPCMPIEAAVRDFVTHHLSQPDP